MFLLSRSQLPKLELRVISRGRSGLHYAINYSGTRQAPASPSEYTYWYIPFDGLRLTVLASYCTGSVSVVSTTPVTSSSAKPSHAYRFGELSASLHCLGHPCAARSGRSSRKSTGTSSISSAMFAHMRSSFSKPGYSTSWSHFPS